MSEMRGKESGLGRLTREKLAGLVRRLEEERRGLEERRGWLEEVARSVSFVSEAVRLKQALRDRQEREERLRKAAPIRPPKDNSVERKTRTVPSRTLLCKEGSAQRVVDALTKELSDVSQCEDAQQILQAAVSFEQPKATPAQRPPQLLCSRSPRHLLNDCQLRELKSEEQLNRRPFAKIDTNQPAETTIDYRLRNSGKKERFGGQKNSIKDALKMSSNPKLERQTIRSKIDPEYGFNFAAQSCIKGAEGRADQRVRKLLFELNHKQSAPVNKYSVKDAKFASKQSVKTNIYDRNDRIVPERESSFGTFGGLPGGVGKYLWKRSQLSGDV